MSLLHRGTDQVRVFSEVTKTDSDGNKITTPDTAGIVCRAVVQPLGLLGAPAESTDRGFNSESRYRLRLIGYTGLLGAQRAVEWNGKRYAIEGDPRVYNGSRRTAHVDYVIVRR
ncbi:head-tail adaptor protein [Mycobacterium colombiense]|uniref:phage head completion protein n=1 Tax=Mycobacterium colombiense TaxID=339268 RepID=UPI0007ECD307|nr:hypothetical protein [Mycobacterium colombiense]OBJ26865.1 hypothetical protein A5620_05430 [Mycobacterium colombiense]